MGGTEDTPTDGETLKGVLQITDLSNDPTLALQLGAVRNSASLVVGSGVGETGHLTIQGGSQFNTTQDVPGAILGSIHGVSIGKKASYLGLRETSLGTVTVDGEGSHWRSSFGFVGYYGTGEVSILNGGRWTSSDVRIGHESGSMGMVSIAGYGSRWEVIGPGGSVEIGSFGTGSLNITNGGAMHSESTMLIVGLANNGTVQISGAGSTMSHTSTFIVGFAGRGEVTIRDGGSLRTGFGTNNFIYADRIGETSKGNAYIIVEEQGSKWNSAQTLIGYNDGSGDMIVRNGGHVLTLDYAAVAHGNNAGNVAAGDSLAVALVASTLTWVWGKVT